MKNEFLRFERQSGLRPIFGYNLRPHENYRIDTDPPRLLSTTADVETFLLSLPRNGIDDEINNEARVQDPGDLSLVLPLRLLPRMLMISCSLCLESRSTIILMNVASADNYSTSQAQIAWFPKLSKSSRILQVLMLSHQEFVLIICTEKACEKKR